MAVTWATQSKKGVFWHSAQEQRTFAFVNVHESFPRVAARDVQPNGFMRVPKNEEYIFLPPPFPLLSFEVPPYRERI